jgi:hypothetical protein
MRKVLVLAGVALLLLSATSMAFNGQRKGFVLGGGLGVAPTASWKVNVVGNLGVEQSGPGLGLNFIIGGAFDDMNLLVYEGNVAGWKDDLFDESVSQGFNGAAWYHYYGPAGKSAFTTVGLGFYVFQEEHYNSNDPGFGMLLGAGYEFAKHWQVGGYFSFGKTSSSGVDFDHHHLNILVSGVAF